MERPDPNPQRDAAIDNPTNQLAQARASIDAMASPRRRI
jgi:hypothetical protein